VQVLEGLNEGDTVVQYSQTALKPGARIAVVEQLLPAGGTK
jgi:HlyD family secretion protein